jgi:hypothetical protein
MANSSRDVLGLARDGVDLPVKQIGVRNNGGGRSHIRCRLSGGTQQIYRVERLWDDGCIDMAY